MHVRVRTLLALPVLHDCVSTCTCAIQVAFLRSGREDAAVARKAHEEQLDAAREATAAAERECREKERDAARARDDVAAAQLVIENKEREIARAAEEREKLAGEIKQLREAAASHDKELAEMKKELKSATAAATPKPSSRGAPPTQSVGSSILNVGRKVGDAIDLDEGADAPPITEQIASALRASSARVLDLFREWDANGDGEVSREEFHRAIPALGLTVPKKEVDALFNEWDKTGDGAIAYKELSKILKSTQRSMAGKLQPPSKAAAGMQAAAAAVSLSKMAKAKGGAEDS